MKKAYALALVTVAMLASVRRTSTGTAPVGEYYVYVWKVFVGEDNYLYLNVYRNFTDSHVQKSGGCSNPWYARSRYPLSDDRTKAWMRIARASLVTRTAVFVTTEGCTDDGRLVLVGLQIERDVVLTTSTPSASPPRVPRGKVCRRDQRCCELLPDGTCVDCIPRGASCP